MSTDAPETAVVDTAETLFEKLKTAFEKLVAADATKIADVKAFFQTRIAELEADAAKVETAVGGEGLLAKAEHAIEGAVKTVEGWFSKDAAEAAPAAAATETSTTEAVAAAAALVVAPVEVAAPAEPAPAPVTGGTVTG